jgi:DNA-directed RNA polymerase subunit alpha
MEEKFSQFLVNKEKETDTKGIFVIEPLFGGLGYSLGNSLRRTLLSALPGFAVTNITVKGARHLFASIKGVKEDLIEIVLNIKKIRIKSVKEESFTMKLDKNGPGEIKASDIDLPAGVEIINKDLVLANLSDKKSNLNIEFTVDHGVGYSLADEHKEEKMGVISVDAIFNPVSRVIFSVVPTRVGKKTNFDKLRLEIETDSTIKPGEALERASKILCEAFNQVASPKAVSLPGRKEEEPEKDENEEIMIDELSLPLRLINALKKANYKKLSDFEGVELDKILSIKNVGKKSVEELVDVLESRGINIKK